MTRKAFAQSSNLTAHMKLHERNSKRDIAPMQDHYVLETPHTVQIWETWEVEYVVVMCQ